MKVLHVTPAFYPATYWGGPIYSVYGLCNSLAGLKDLNLKVLTTDSAGPKKSQSISYNSVPEVYEPGYQVYFTRRIAGYSISITLIIKLPAMVREADVIHLMGVYVFPAIPTLLLARVYGKPVVWSPRGSLQRWEGSTRLISKAIWEWVCNFIIRSHNCTLHATAEHEAALAKKRIPNAHVEIIPNGVSLPTIIPTRLWRPEGRLRLLYIGRLDPIKGLENLFHSLKLLSSHVHLMVCGTGDGSYEKKLSDLVESLDLSSRVEFMGHVSGEEKFKAFNNADVCVVPSYSENFAMVVVEALAHGVPVIAGKGSPWAKLDEVGCGYWIENDPASLANAIKEIENQDLAGMGIVGRKWMERDYSEDSVAEKMLDIYKQVGEFEWV